jgi:hypothetical protein
MFREADEVRDVCLEMALVVVRGRKAHVAAFVKHLHQCRFNHLSRITM